jgi:hypothetical protein
MVIFHSYGAVYQAGYLGCCKVSQIIFVDPQVEFSLMTWNQRGLNTLRANHVTLVRGANFALVAVAEGMGYILLFHSVYSDIW